MGALTFGLTYVGYWLLAYGVATVRGCNVTLVQIGWPGRFAGCNSDSGGSDPGASATSLANPNPKNPITVVPGSNGKIFSDTPFAPYAQRDKNGKIVTV